MSLGLPGGISAQTQQPGKSPAPQSQKPEGRIVRDVDLVVLHASVLDVQGHVVTDMKREDFRVFEDKVEQQLALFSREDIPVSMGLVIDNSGSMKEKREKVNAAALTLIKTSNPQDEVFVVNFNEDYYLDMDKNFTNDIEELKEALERIDSRGSTALYDAIIGSLDHVKKGKRDKKVLLVVTDGQDTVSHASLEKTVLEAQKSDAVIYSIGVLGTDNKKTARRAREALTKISQATGGLAFFPEGLHEVESICAKIAHDIRSQYTLAYYPTNNNRDGTFRSVRVELKPPRGRSKLNVRTRSGYYAPKASSGAQ